MSWAISHGTSERFASGANDALRRDDGRRARMLFQLAAQAETEALSKLDTSKPRTLGITAVSAVALWYKSGDLETAERLALWAVALKGIPVFARHELQELLRAIWDAEVEAVRSGPDHRGKSPIGGHGAVGVDRLTADDPLSSLRRLLLASRGRGGAIAPKDREALVTLTLRVTAITLRVTAFNLARTVGLLAKTSRVSRATVYRMIFSTCLIKISSSKLMDRFT